MASSPDKTGQTINIPCMQLFYATQIEYATIRLDAEESRHCIKVMRMKKGDTLYLTDGRGNLYRCILAEPDPEGCVLEIADTRQEVGKRPYSLHIAIAMTKNTDRFEWFVEKAVETGIDRITPLITARSERKNIRTDRLRSIAISAMKQSVKTYLPAVDEPATLDEILGLPHSGEKYICHCLSGEKVQPGSGFHPRQALVLIGPEGDFTADEVTRVQEQGWASLSLGESKFRTETAGLAACMAVYLAHVK